jgi:hypothetical protein
MMPTDLMWASSGIFNFFLAAFNKEKVRLETRQNLQICSSFIE